MYITEYEEITENYSIEDCERELKYQIMELGYLTTDSFPQYLVDLIANKRDSDGRDKCGN